jgi:hypothetical protein
MSTPQESPTNPPLDPESPLEQYNQASKLEFKAELAVIEARKHLETCQDVLELMKQRRLAARELLFNPPTTTKP